MRRSVSRAGIPGRETYHGPSASALYSEIVDLSGGLSSGPARGADMGDRDNPVTSLVDAAASGDEPAWREVVDRYTPLLARVLRRLLVACLHQGDETGGGSVF